MGLDGVVMASAAAAGGGGGGGGRVGRRNSEWKRCVQGV